jgi:hypothetical protein
MHPKKRLKKCVCSKDRHISKGAAEAQVRALIKLQTIPNSKKDLKSVRRLNSYRSKSCERAINDGKQVWHVGHK